MSGMWYLRFYDSWKVAPDKTVMVSKNVGHIVETRTKGYRELIMSAHDVLTRTKGQVKFDAVELDTGRIARHDYKKPLPEWLNEAVVRQIAATTGKIP